jgi:hypothetical protein
MSSRFARTLVLAAIAALAALALAGPAAARPCEPVSETSTGGGGGGGTTASGTRTVTVTGHAPGSAITSSPSGLNCGATCSTSQTVSALCDPDCAWPAATTWTLTATAPPAGYTASWTGCDSSTATSCSTSAGDETTGSATRNVSLSWADTTAPTVTFNPPAKVGPSNYNVGASASDNSGAVASYQWAVDGVTQGATGSVLSLSGMANGSHTVVVRAGDGSGNLSAPVSRTVAVDRSVSVSPGSLPTYTNNATAPLSFTYDSDVVTVNCSANGGAFTSCSSPWSFVTAATPDGTYDYRVKVTDDVGNSVTSAPVSVIVDRTLPALAFTDGPSEGQQVATRSAAITFSRTEAHPAALDCALDGAAVACTPGTAVTLQSLGDGAHAFSVHAVDSAGNARTITRTFAVKLPDSGSGTDTSTGTATPDTSGGSPAQQPSTGTTATGATTTFAARISGSFARKGTQTRATALKAAGLPAGSTITVSCSGRGCALKRTVLKGKSGTVDVLKALRKKVTLRPGNVLTVRVAAPGGETRTSKWLARKGKAPKLTQS